MLRRPETKPPRIGLAWFDREQWQQLTEVVPNRSELDDTYEQWERGAEKALKKVARSGQQIEKVPIRVDELLSWCTLRGLVPDGKARAEFVTELLRKKYGSQS
jgi:hypothetical protein